MSLLKYVMEWYKLVEVKLKVMGELGKKIVKSIRR